MFSPGFRIGKKELPNIHKMNIEAHKKTKKKLEITGGYLDSGAIIR